RVLVPAALHHHGHRQHRRQGLGSRQARCPCRPPARGRRPTARVALRVGPNEARARVLATLTPTMPVRERLAAGREAYQRGDWSTAFAAFQAADATVPLSGGDLEAWASTAFLLGDQSGYERLLDRAHLSHLDRGDIERAAF